MKPTAIIVTIGDEILIGQIANSNSQWLAQKLFSIGFTVVKMVSIGDNPQEVKDILEYTKNRYALVIFTGGLGPTNDDKTKLILTQWFNSKLILNEDVLANITNMVFRRTGSHILNQRNHDQALVPECCTVLQNEVGTAPGMIFNKCGNNTVYVSLPGVPFEMKWIYENHVLNFVQQNFDLIPQTYDLFYVMGISESALAHRLEEWENSLPEEWKPAYLPSAGLIKLRIFRPNPITEIYANSLAELTNLLGENLVASNEESVQDSIARLLIANNLTIGTAESCTGGNIAKTFTSKSGASHYFKGSVVAYSNDVKINLLGVKSESLNQFGAVSKEVAEQMAIGLAKKTNCHIAIATTGVAGPTGGTIDKPVGTVWISIYIMGQIFSEKFQFSTLREVNIERSTNTAIYLTYKHLSDFIKQ
jgi:nicotinamide-nucleotide amidase